MFYDQIRGKKRELSDEHKRNIAKANRKRLKGKTLPKEWRENMSKARRGEGNGMFGKTHSVEARRKISKKRKGNNYGRVGKKASMFGRIWVSNDVQSIVIPKEQLEQYLGIGFTRGRRHPRSMIQ